MPCCGISRASATATGGNTHLRPAAVALALGATICRLQVMSGFGQTGHRADKAEWPSLTHLGHWAVKFAGMHNTFFRGGARM